MWLNELLEINFRFAILFIQVSGFVHIKMLKSMRKITIRLQSFATSNRFLFHQSFNSANASLILTDNNSNYVNHRTGAYMCEFVESIFVPKG